LKLAALRLTLAAAPAALVQELVRNAWTRKAPKRLVSVNRPGTKGVA